MDAIIGTHSRIRLEESFTALSKAFALAGVAAKKAVSSFTDFGKKWCFKFLSYRVSRRQVKRAQIYMFFSKKQHAIFAVKPTNSPIDYARKAARLRK